MSVDLDVGYRVTSHLYIFLSITSIAHRVPCASLHTERRKEGTVGSVLVVDGVFHVVRDSINIGHL